MHKIYYSKYLALISSDFLITLFTFIAVAYLRPFLPGQEITPSMVIIDHWLYLITPLSLLTVFGLQRLYGFSQFPGLSFHMRLFVPAYALWGWVLVAILYFSFRETSRLFVIYFGAANFVALTICRLILWETIARTGNKKDGLQILIVGPPQSVARLDEAIVGEFNSGYTIAGYVDCEESNEMDLPTPFLGKTERLSGIVRDKRIDIVIISMDDSGLTSLEPLIMELIKIPVRVFLAQSFSRLPLIELEVERIGNLVLTGLFEPVINGWNRLFKRIFDLVFTCVSLVLLWPMFLVIALVIKIESSGPVIYKAQRVGSGGKLFTMYKFRTMADESEKLWESLVQIDDQGRKIFKTKDDPRITRAGRFLRRWSLDELPQFINVLKGEMSIVGPRPEQRLITEDYEPWQWQRVLVPPGITGWWQISGRGEIPMHFNTHLDVHYVANYSMLLDLKIIFLTVFEVLRGRGAY